MTVATAPVQAASIAALAELDAMVAAMVRLSDLAVGAAGWPAAGRRTALQRLDRAVDGLVAARAAVLVAEREAGTWQGSGDRSFEAWRGRTARTGERSAAAQVRQADGLASVPGAAAAVSAGRIRLDHAAAIAKVAATGTPVQQRAARDATVQADLLTAAERLDAGTFATTVARWAAGLDPDALEADHQAQRAERFLHLTPTSRGTFVKGRLDAMAGHRLILALEALSPRPAADDDRDPGQRRADALDAMAGRILTLVDTKPGGHVPPQVSMILTAETWAAARAHRDLQRRHGLPRSSIPGTASSFEPADQAGGTRAGSYPPATLEDGTPVSPSEVARAMCDCAVTRIVVDAAGVPLDVGRAQRLFTGEQRRAVIARDRGCVWPGCHAHARWCEVHHIAWWDRDTGRTSIDNGALLCSYHHHEVHRRDLTLTRLPVRSSPERPSPGAPAALALVGYLVRDPAGRLVGPPTPVGAPSPRTPPADDLRQGSGRVGEPPGPPPGARMPPTPSLE